MRADTFTSPTALGARPSVLPLGARIHVAGHRGLVGSAIWRHLESRGYSALLGRTSTELDLRDRPAVFDFYNEVRPEYVVVAAARVGGIMANSNYPADFLSDNIRIEVNVMDAAQLVGVRRLLFLGSSCIYPKYAAQPIREDSLLTGLLEPTNDAYAIAKIAGVLHVQAMRRQHQVSFISAMPTNVYGPGDNFDLQTSHVLPAMMSKLHQAALEGRDQLTLWGSGSPRREFLHVDDLAAACELLLRDYDDSAPINVGTGRDLTIRELAAVVARVVGFEGRILWDTSKPDGTPQKLLDVSKLTSLGWSPRVSLEEGIASTFRWYLSNVIGGTTA